MARLFHPKRRALEKWLEDDAKTDAEAKANDKVEQHIATCDRCAGTIESLSETPTVEAEVRPDRLHGIQQALATTLATPEDLTERLERKVTARLDSRVMFDVVTDLFGAGVETSRLLLMEENDE